VWVCGCLDQFGDPGSYCYVIFILTAPLSSTHSLSLHLRYFLNHLPVTFLPWHKQTKQIHTTTTTTTTTTDTAFFPPKSPWWPHPSTQTTTRITMHPKNTNKRGTMVAVAKTRPYSCLDLKALDGWTSLLLIDPVKSPLISCLLQRMRLGSELYPTWKSNIPEQFILVKNLVFLECYFFFFFFFFFFGPLG
jgi:hypothetical protein